MHRSSAPSRRPPPSPLSEYMQKTFAGKEITRIEDDNVIQSSIKKSDFTKSPSSETFDRSSSSINSVLSARSNERWESIVRSSSPQNVRDCLPRPATRRGSLQDNHFDSSSHFDHHQGETAGSAAS